MGRPRRLGEGAGAGRLAGPRLAPSLRRSRCVSGEQLVFEFEYVRTNAPYRPSTQSEHLFGPTLLRFGSEAQKQRFLPAILIGDTYWAQGFSEPDAGSDLAGVRTRATLDGDRWVIDGQKIWTTFGHRSQWIYVLCRSDSEAERHRGLSFLLVPIDQPGVEIRPIRTLAATADFSEVFFNRRRHRRGPRRRGAG